jgi:hypothetical protein
LAVFVAIFDIFPSLLLFATLHLTINFCCLQCYVLTLIIFGGDYTLHHSLLFCVMLYCVIYQSGYHHPVVFIKSISISITQQYEHCIQYILLNTFFPTDMTIIS